MSQEFDPYRKWLGIPPEEQPAHHYRLLGIAPFEEDPDVIDNAANRQMAHVRTFQSGRHSQWSQKILNQLAAARLCLLNAEKKRAYDQQLRSQLAKQSAVPQTPSESKQGAIPTPRRTLPPPAPPSTSPPPVAEGTTASEPVPRASTEADPESIDFISRKGSVRSASVLRRVRPRRKSSPWPLLLGIVALTILAGVLVVVLYG